MALSKSIILNNGLMVNNAYIRIDGLSGYKGNLDIYINSYVSKEIFESGKDYLEQKKYSFIPSVEDGSANFIKQGYEYLKALDEYIDATDC